MSRFLSLEAAMVTPSLAALVSQSAGDRPGGAFGLQGAANSLGRAVGPVTGSALLVMNVHAPSVVTVLMFGVAALSLRGGCHLRKPGARDVAENSHV